MNEEERWPQEVLDAYANMDVPSLYEVLLIQERLASEIRKQNKELKVFKDALERNHDHLVEEFEHRFALFSEKLAPPSVDQGLMHLADGLRNLQEQVSSSFQTLTRELPSHALQALFTYKRWKEHAESLMDAMQEMVHLIYQKGVTTLDDLGLGLIEPEVGDSFSSVQHRVVETVSSRDGSRGIAKVLRLGFQKDGVVLRPAEVSVYISKEADD